MSIDTAPVKAAADRAVALLEQLHTKVGDLANQLAAANAANDPAGQAAVQQALADIASSVNAEVDKVSPDVATPPTA